MPESMRMLARGFATTARCCNQVFINRLAVNAIPGPDGFNRATLQPVAISLAMETDFSKASAGDDLSHSINYAVVSRAVGSHFKQNERRDFGSLTRVGAAAAAIALDPAQGGHADLVCVTVESRRNEILADRLWARVVRPVGGVHDVIGVEGVRMRTLIGVFPFERERKQLVTVDVELSVEPEVAVDTHAVVEAVVEYVERLEFQTVEALVEAVVQVVRERQPQVASARAKVLKLNAIAMADSVGVGVERSGAVEAVKTAVASTPVDYCPGEDVECYIAVGSNVGDSVGSITASVEMLRARGVVVEATSLLYVLLPMYYQDQPDFVNGVFKATTQLSPEALLRVLQSVETDLLRTKTIEKGPRLIDLDIVLYGQHRVDAPHLQIPHIGMLERTFVMEPLCELVDAQAVHPGTAEPLHSHLRQLVQQGVDTSKQALQALERLVPGPHGRSLRLGARTWVMGVVNTTPDLFSDGGSLGSVEDAVKRCEEMVRDGADILDIGGASTRPGSVAPSVEEETARVVPVIAAVRCHSDPAVREALILVDTYRLEVARAAVAAGADIVNDVTGGTGDAAMAPMVAETGAVYVACHSRGDTAGGAANSDYSAGSVVRDGEEAVGGAVVVQVARELSAVCGRVMAAGVHKWKVVVDPNFGFAKTTEQNYELLGGLGALRQYRGREGSLAGFPLLVGMSRKRFVGEAVGEPTPSRRDFGLAGAAVCAVQGGADVVRVHEVRGTVQAVVVADRVWR